jgi:hypothetical protein
MLNELKDKILDGRWKVVGKDEKSSRYLFENVYNHQIIKLSYRQINQVINGKDTISKIQSRRIGSYNEFQTKVRNSVTRCWGKIKWKYANGGELA